MVTATTFFTVIAGILVSTTLYRTLDRATQKTQTQCRPIGRDVASKGPVGQAMSRGN